MHDTFDQYPFGVIFTLLTTCKRETVTVNVATVGATNKIHCVCLRKEGATVYVHEP